MKRPNGKALRVERGDLVEISARLARSAVLNRLFVFARQGEDDFIPYVPHMNDLMQDKPQLMTPMSLRVNDRRPKWQISFRSDITGEICVMEETDTAKDPLAKVWLRRKINPELPWTQRLTKRITGVFA